MPIVEFSGGRLWIDDIPDQFHYTPIETLTFALATPSKTNISSQRLCFEINLIREKMDNGVLGVEYIPDETGYLTIEIYIAERGGSQGWDMNIPGLSGEYAYYVLDQAKAFLEKNNRLGSGHLVFKYAQEHPVNSNPRLFRLLTQILLTLMSRTTLTFTDDEKRTFVFDQFREI